MEPIRELGDLNEGLEVGDESLPELRLTPPILPDVIDEIMLILRESVIADT
jgi:hypothetical protein